MGVYLPNVDMPKEGFVEILIRDDGTVQQTGQSFRIGGTDYYTPYVGEMPAMYKAVPAADVRPVVLCRDCVHFSARSGGSGYCSFLDIGTSQEAFCSHGEEEES